MTTRVLFAALLCVCFGSPVSADDDEQRNLHELPRVQLFDVLEAVSRRTDLEFLVDRRVDAEVVVGPVDAKKIDYKTLLLVLRNNRMAAVKIGGLVNIINVATVRQYPLPVIEKENDSIDDEEWVTMFIKLDNGDARQLIPILRPMLPQAGHMVGHTGSNTVTIVDRYGNVKRILELIRKIDALTRSQLPQS